VQNRPLRPSDLLYRSKLGVPWASLLLIASCFLVTIPVFIEPRRYYLTLGVGFCAEDAPVHWWHYVVARFVHGVGCGFPPTWFHIGVNVSLFLFHGAIVERLLGAGRFALLTLTSLAVSVPLAYFFAEGRLHGASCMTWSYMLFLAWLIAWMWKVERWKIFKDWVTGVVAFWLLFGLLGLPKQWHLYNLLVSIPFFFVWRKTLRANFDALSRSEALDTGSRAGNLAGIAACAGIFAFNAFWVLSAWRGWITPELVRAIP
jgi:membrane associated rhomboid family serine protease